MIIYYLDIFPCQFWLWRCRLPDCRTCKNGYSIEWKYCRGANNCCTQVSWIATNHGMWKQPLLTYFYLIIGCSFLWQLHFENLKVIKFPYTSVLSILIPCFSFQNVKIQMENGNMIVKKNSVMGRTVSLTRWDKVKESVF